MNLQDVLLSVGGAIILILLTVVGHFVVLWMNRHDSRADNTASLLAAHDKEIAVIKRDADHVLGTLARVANDLKEHIQREESFWETQEDRHKELLGKLIDNEARLIRMEERHLIEDKNKRGVA